MGNFDLKLATVPMMLETINAISTSVENSHGKPQICSSARNAEYALSKLLQMGTVAEYESGFVIRANRVTGEAFSLAHIAEARFEESVKNCFGPSKYEDMRGALSKLLQLGTVEDYQREFEKLMNREIAKKEHNIKEKADTILSLPSEEASLVVKGPLNASEDTLLSLRSEDLNFKIKEKAVEYVRALNVSPLEVVFAGPVDEFHGKFAEFSKDKGCVEKILSATKLPEGGNSHLAYSSYHLEGKALDLNLIRTSESESEA
ncbi:hypothetical protein Tco_0661921 [Tanacetum coccineum]